jgi:hypothetical protein
MTVKPSRLSLAGPDATLSLGPIGNILVRNAARDTTRADATVALTQVHVAAIFLRNGLYVAALLNRPAVRGIAFEDFAVKKHRRSGQMLQSRAPKPG